MATEKDIEDGLQLFDQLYLQLPEGNVLKRLELPGFPIELDHIKSWSPTKPWVVSCMTSTGMTIVGQKQTPYEQRLLARAKYENYLRKKLKVKRVVEPKAPPSPQDLTARDVLAELNRRKRIERSWK